MRIKDFTIFRNMKMKDLKLKTMNYVRTRVNKDLIDPVTY